MAGSVEDGVDSYSSNLPVLICGSGGGLEKAALNSMFSRVSRDPLVSTLCFGVEECWLFCVLLFFARCCISAFGGGFSSNA